MTEPTRTPAEKQALRELVVSERRRKQRSRWSLAGASAGAVTSASLLGLVVTAWLRQEHQDVPRAQVLTQHKVIATIRYVRPKPRIKVVKVVRHRAVTPAASVQRVSASLSPAASVPSRTSAVASAPAPAPRVQVQISKPTPAAAPPPPPVSTHAS
ncbi:MAG TPA: hypothetical protein VK501_00735 [Baekduia sp.]|uniref:hypothetical protein n=1 Tax=Baekduia sp. TaxID=2600305 RepID=UPI002B7D0B15|nr:hypothetical protein [Baekduia sp.]HMJ32412.1 hypothetical protein [Baekduia sp.]